jgi:hypothetical protein
VHLIRDLRFGVRLFTRHTTFAAAAVTVVALGIGATTTVFSIVRAVLLQPLPYREPQRLVLFRTDGPGIVRQALITGYEVAAIRTRPDLFESIAVINESPGNITGPGDMEAVTAASPSDNFLDTLGMHPALGRMVSRQVIVDQLLADRMWPRQSALGQRLLVHRAAGNPTETEVSSRTCSWKGCAIADCRMFS